MSEPTATPLEPSGTLYSGLSQDSYDILAGYNNETINAFLSTLSPVTIEGETYYISMSGVMEIMEFMDGLGYDTSVFESFVYAFSTWSLADF